MDEDTLNRIQSKLKDAKGAPVTQSLFLEIGYNERLAVYTLKDVDKEYKGHTYPSLKRLYLQMEDVVEYEFANTYLSGWQHWQKMCNNKQLAGHIEEWRDELELKLRSQAVRDIIDASAEDKGFQALKWLADKGWDRASVGRPTKDMSEKNKGMKARLDDEFAGDVLRMDDYKN